MHSRVVEHSRVADLHSPSHQTQHSAKQYAITHVYSDHLVRDADDSFARGDSLGDVEHEVLEVVLLRRGRVELGVEGSAV